MNTKVEGPGNRTCIFVQGCLKHCPECNSQQSWDINGGLEYDINHLAKSILSNKEIEGVTFSGGEPFLQSRQLYQLAKILKKHKLSIVTFTGYEYEFIKKINGKEYKCYSVFYPVGNGRFNIGKSIEDINYIMDNIKDKILI